MKTGYKPRKGVRLGETWKTFQREHPEIEVRKNPFSRKIEEVHFPENTRSYFIIYNCDEVICLDYISSSGRHVQYPI